VCGRYVRKSDKQKIAEHFAVHGPSVPDFGPSWNVAPQTFQPIVRLNRDTGERELVLMRWGLIPYWAKDPSIGLRTINAKAETITTTSAFREAIKYRRCLSASRRLLRVAEAGREDQATVRHWPQEQRALRIRGAVGEMEG
jgi:putative SOS response-associated peptidase YedK